MFFDSCTEYAKRRMSYSGEAEICEFSLRRSAVDIEPVTCNGHLPHPWGWSWREGWVGSWTQGVVGQMFKTFRRAEARMFCIHESAHRSP